MQITEEQLIAPCGMNCALCSRYLAFKNNLPKVKGKIMHCEGCRKLNRQCAFIKKQCEDNKKILKGNIDFCFECNCFPCDKLKKLDKRYQSKYNMSMIENLTEIKAEGIQKFISNQNKKYECPKCKGLISVHNKKCFTCDEVKSWNK